MQLIELETVRHRLHAGTPLPFNVSQADHTLLLARGQIVESGERMEALFDRGMLVDIAELQASCEQILATPLEQLPAVWEQLSDRIGQALRSPLGEGFDAVLKDVAQPLLALIEREPDLTMFQVLRQSGNRLAQYGVNHSIHCAIASSLAAQRLGWDESGVRRAVKAALTMNVAMLELQGQLATQVAPLTPQQSQDIHAHPRRGVRQLQLAGISDTYWLQAVAEHHDRETSDGTGYAGGGLSKVMPLGAHAIVAALGTCPSGLNVAPEKLMAAFCA